MKNFTSQFTVACFIYRKVRVLCFAPPVLYLKGQINFCLTFVNFFCLFLVFKHGVRAGAWAVELEPEPPLFSKLRLQPKRAAPAQQHWSSVWRMSDKIKTNFYHKWEILLLYYIFLLSIQKMSHFLSGNIGMAGAVAKMKGKWSRSWSRNRIILAPQHWKKLFNFDWN